MHVAQEDSEPLASAKHHHYQLSFTAWRGRLWAPPRPPCDPQTKMNHLPLRVSEARQGRPRAACPSCWLAVQEGHPTVSLAVWQIPSSLLHHPREFS